MALSRSAQAPEPRRESKRALAALRRVLHAKRPDDSELRWNHGGAPPCEPPGFLAEGRTLRASASSRGGAPANSAAASVPASRSSAATEVEKPVRGGEPTTAQEELSGCSRLTCSGRRIVRPCLIAL